MDQKSWLWKKKSTEKTLLADKASNSMSKNEEEVTEVQKLLNEKTGLAKDIGILNEKLSSTLSDCNAKDNIAKKQVKIAEEAIAGWEKAETEAIVLKQELDKVLHQKAFSEERVDHLDAALKECMHQLRFVREEQERRVHGALTKTSEEFEKIRIALDEQLMEASKIIAKLDAENTQLSKSLSEKEKVIEGLGKYKSQLEGDSNALLLRLESTEKENASLKYEVHVLEKELEIRNEEREFDRRITGIAQKQQQESAKKIANLETECQSLRLLVQTRLPGPATLAKMRSEVKSLVKDHAEMKRRKSNLSPTTSTEFSTEGVPDVSSERINLLTEQLYTMVEENGALKDALSKKSSELQFSRKMYGRTSSISPRSAGLVEESLKCQVPVEPGKYLCFLQEHSLAASSDVSSDDKASCAESWASALISELGHLKNEKQLRTPSHRNMGTSDMNLMDDFAEMEKLAVLSLDNPAGSPKSSSEESNAILGSPSGAHSSSEPVRGGAPICGNPSEHVISSQEIRSGCLAGNGIPEKLGDLLKMLLEHSHSSQRNPHDLLEDIRFSLDHYKVDSTVFCGNTSTHHAEASYNGSGHVLQASSNKSSNMRNENNISVLDPEKSGQKFGSSVSIPIRKVLELLEGINIQSQDNGTELSSGKDEKILSYKNSGNPTGYIVRVFQWKTAELSAIVQQFVQTCNDLLNGNANLEQFTLQMASSLEWIMSHCFSLQDVSSMKDAIRNHLDWDDSGSESEEEREPVSHMHSSSSKMEVLELPLKEEVKIWNVEWIDKESTMATGSEGCLQSETCMRESFIIDGIWNFHTTMIKEDLETQLIGQSEVKFENQFEKQKMIKEDLETQLIGQSEVKFENQFEKQKMIKEDLETQLTGQLEGKFENQKMIKEDLETQLMEINHEWGKACEKISLLQNALENKNNCYKRLEETCHELQIQLKSSTCEEVPVPDNGKDEKKQVSKSNDWEITAASEKLAECQETILNLGKQLKALASPCDASLFDKLISAPVDDSPVAAGRSISRRSSLLAKMLAEDGDPCSACPDTKTKDHKGTINSCVSTNGATESSVESTNPNGINHEQKNKTAVAALDIVSCKKHGRASFFKRLFWRRKKGKNDKTPIS